MFKWLKKLKYWKRATIIGFIIGLLVGVFSVVSLTVFESLPRFFRDMLRPLGYFTYNWFYNLNEYYCFSHRFFYDTNNPISYICGFSTIVGYFLIFGIVGGLIGLSIGKIKGKFCSK